jgi:hypothetical protein
MSAPVPTTDSGHAGPHQAGVTVEAWGPPQPDDAVV